MTCRRAFDADLLALLRGEEGDADFRAHYPSCPECSAEVAVWGELDAMLRAGAPADRLHPEPETLLALVDDSPALGPAMRVTVERHLASCRVCADETRTLRAFEPARLGASAPARATDARPPLPVTAERSATGRRLARVLWHPAFAYALVALLMVPVVRELRPRMEEPPPPPTSFDQREGDGARIAEALRSEPGALAPRPEAAVAPAQPRATVPLAPAPALGPPLAPPPPAPAPRARRDDDAMGKRALAPKPPAEAESRDAADSAALLPPQEGTPAARRAEGAVAKTEPLPEALGAPSAGAGRARSGSSTAVAERGDEKVGGADRATARALSDSREHAAPAATAGEGPFVLEIGAGQPTIVPYVPVAGAVRLRIRPSYLVPAPLDVWVRERAGQREIHRRVADPATAIDIDLPPHWLVPGVYAVTLQPVDGGAPATLTFTVPMPTGDRD